MADFSLVELGVYGLIGYAGVITLIISILLNPPTSRSLAGSRSVFLMPSVICLLVLSFSGGIIELETTTTTYDGVETTLIYNDTDDLIFTENVTKPNQTTTNTITMVNPIWIPLHFIFAIILIIYILVQVFSIFTKPE